MKRESKNVKFKVDVQMPGRIKRSRQDDLVYVLKLLALVVLLLTILVAFLVGASSLVNFILRLLM
jgi:hypothetical protein